MEPTYTSEDVIVAVGTGAPFALEAIEHCTQRNVHVGQIFLIAADIPTDVMMPVGTYAGITNILDGNLEGVVGGATGYDSPDHNFVNVVEVLGTDEMGDSPKYDVKPGHLYKSPRLEKIVGLIADMVVNEEQELEEEVV
jgi:hypothetical protein